MGSVECRVHVMIPSNAWLLSLDGKPSRGLSSYGTTRSCGFMMPVLLPMGMLPGLHRRGLLVLAPGRAFVPPSHILDSCPAHL